MLSLKSKRFSEENIGGFVIFVTSGEDKNIRLLPLLGFGKGQNIITGCCRFIGGRASLRNPCR